MSYKKSYMDTPEKAEQWLDDLKDFSRHTEIDLEDMQSSALLVIDMQNYFLSESSHAYIPSVEAIIPNINKLITIYTRQKLPVIFTRYAVLGNEDITAMTKWWNDILRDGTTEAELSPKLNLPQDPIVIRKNTYDSFHNTGLKEILDERGIRAVAVTGVMTHLCCETTARSAFVNNYMVYFIIDANATMNEELHCASLRTLSDGFAVPVLTEKLVSAFDNPRSEGDNRGKV